MLYVYDKFFCCTLSWSLNSSDIKQRIKRMQRQQRRAKAGWTRGKLLPGSFIAVLSQGMSTATCVSSPRLSLCTSESVSQLLLNSHVYTLQPFGPCIIILYNCSFTHTFTWLSSVRIAVEITIVSWKCFHHSRALSRAMMWPTLTVMEMRWRNFLAVFRLGYSFAKSVTELY